MSKFTTAPCCSGQNILVIIIEIVQKKNGREFVIFLILLEGQECWCFRRLFFSGMTFKAVSKEATKLTVSFSKPPAPSVEVRHLTNQNKSGFIWSKIRIIFQFHHRIFVTCFYHHKSPKPKFPSIDKGSVTLLKAFTYIKCLIWPSTVTWCILVWIDRIFSFARIF